MGDTANDPAHQVRTTRRHGANAPGLLILSAAIVAMVVAVVAFATGSAAAGLAATAVAAVGLLAGAGWLSTTHRQVRRLELRWLADRRRSGAQPPAS